MGERGQKQDTEALRGPGTSQSTLRLLAKTHSRRCHKHAGAQDPAESVHGGAHSGVVYCPAGEGSQAHCSDPAWRRICPHSIATASCLAATLLCRPTGMLWASTEHAGVHLCGCALCRTVTVPGHATSPSITRPRCPHMWGTNPTSASNATRPCVSHAPWRWPDPGKTRTHTSHPQSLPHVTALACRTSIAACQ